MRETIARLMKDDPEAAATLIKTAFDKCVINREEVKGHEEIRNGTRSKWY